MQQVVGLVGLRGAGKDTAALVLLEKGWRRIGFADALYLEAAGAFNQPVSFFERRETKELPQPELALANCEDQLFVAVMLMNAGLQLGKSDGRTVRAFLRMPRSPREIMQNWGTEYRRKVFRDDYWRAQVEMAIRAEPAINFVVTDVRFPDEAKLVEDTLGGRLGRVTRPGLAGADDKSLLHSSEVAMLEYPIAREFINLEGAAGRESFRQQVRAAFG